MPVMSAMARLLVECDRGDVRGSVVAIMYRHAPRLTADLTVFDVALLVAAAGVDAHGVRLAAIGTGDLGGGIRRAIAEWEVAVKVELVVGVVGVECKVHFEA